MRRIWKRNIFYCFFVVVALLCVLLGDQSIAEEKSNQEKTAEFVRAGNIMLLNKQTGVFFHGKITEEGNVMLHDGKGNYLHGRVRPDGKVTMHDGKGNFLHGTLKPDGELRFFSVSGGAFHGRIVWADELEGENE